MVTTVARQVQSINKISSTFFEVIGSTGNKYRYDVWADVCNCPAGQNNKDCYHAKTVREQIDQEKFEASQKITVLTGVTAADVTGAVRDMGLTAEFIPGVNSLSIGGMRRGSLVKVSHHKEALCEILFSGTDFTVYSSQTGKIHNHSMFRVDDKVGAVKKQLDNLLGLKFKLAKDSLFCNWSGDVDYPERPRKSVKA
jgi:hypothetical protein